MNDQTTENGNLQTAMANLELATAHCYRHFQCRHIFPEGRRCGSPALRREDFCYFHHPSRARSKRRRRVPTFDPAADSNLSYADSSLTVLDLPPLTDFASIQAALTEVVRAIAANRIDGRRAGRIVYALQIASSNLPKTPHPR